MLTAIRTTFSKGLARLILTGLIGLLIVSFAIWGIQDVVRGFGATDVATIGETRISQTEFQEAYQRELQALSRQTRTAVTPEQARALGLDQALLGRLVSDAALNERARELGLALSDETIAALVASDPQFQGGTGRFNRALFEEALRQAGLPEALFFARQNDASLRRQLAEGLVGGGGAPLVLAEALNRFGEETRDITLITLPATLAGDIPAPDEATLAAWFEANKGRFRAPEMRKYTVMQLSPEAIAAKTVVSDDDARADYDSRIDRYSTPERRTVQQIAFPDAASAKAAADRLAAGTVTFDALASERGVAPADLTLGTFAKAQMIDPVIAEAAFALAENQPSGVIAGKLSNVILRVTAIEPARVTPFEQVAAGIKQAMALDRASRELLEIQGRIEDERAGGQTLAEIAPKFGLVAAALETDANGQDAAGAKAAVPAADLVLPAVFATEPGFEADVIDAREQGLVWFEVADIVPSRERTLEEARPAVIEAWTAAERDRLLRERADAMLAELRAGKSLDEVAKAAGLETRQAWALKRNETAQGLGADAIAVVFATPVGSHATALAGNGSERIVFRLDDNFVPSYDAAAPAIVEARKRLGAILADDLVGQYVARSQDELGLSINQTLIDRAIGLQTGS